MGRTVVSKAVLDRLIRSKMATVPKCAQVEALPIVCDVRGPGGSNWSVPGWTGHNGNVPGCLDALKPYLYFLGTQFNVPEES